MSQIWVAMIHYLLIAYLKFLYGFKLGMTELTNRIRDTLMQNQSLLEVLSLDRKILEKPPNWNLPVQEELFSPLLLWNFYRTAVGTLTYFYTAYSMSQNIGKKCQQYRFYDAFMFFIPEYVIFFEKFYKQHLQSGMWWVIFNTSQFDMECGGVAQLVSAPPCHGGCCGFESRLSRHFFAKMVSQRIVFSSGWMFDRVFYAGE